MGTICDIKQIGVWKTIFDNVKQISEKSWKFLKKVPTNQGVVNLIEMQNIKTHLFSTFHFY